MAEDAAEKWKITDWVTEQRTRKWMWAGRVLRRTDARWKNKMVEWRPTDGYRDVGHPKKRWLDSIMACLATKSVINVKEKAENELEWEELASLFVGQRW
eukprot:12163856-Karenia_brevis.AAC.1